MKGFPRVPTGAAAVESELSGHLWVLEALAGDPFRFRLRADGRIEFGDDERTFDGDPPAVYRAAVRHVRERLDRERLRTALADPSSVTFLGTATVHRGIDYDWTRLPPFLGREVHDGEAFLGPGAVEGIYERLGLDPANAVGKELRAADFDPDRYDHPRSAWYDGPAAAVVLRDKTGGRVRLPNPAAGGRDPDPIDGDPDDVAARLVTDRRVERAVQSLDARDRPTGFDAVFERVLDAIHREAADRLGDGRTDLDPGALRSAVASEVRRRLDG